MSSPQGAGEKRDLIAPLAGPATPCPPFSDNGVCPTCGGYGEHFASCPYATWERREL